VAISATGVVEKAHTFAEQVREIAVKWEELKALIGAAATTGEEIQKGIHTTVTLGKAYIADI
jgi:aromatic ring hydroxylase